jgi:hypothetical protein
MMGFPEALSKTMTHLSGLAEETLPAAKIVDAINYLLHFVNMELDQRLANLELMETASLEQVSTAALFYPTVGIVSIVI